MGCTLQTAQCIISVILSIWMTTKTQKNFNWKMLQLIFQKNMCLSEVEARVQPQQDEIGILEDKVLLQVGAINVPYQHDSACSGDRNVLLNFLLNAKRQEQGDDRGYIMQNGHGIRTKAQNGSFMSFDKFSELQICEIRGLIINYAVFFAAAYLALSNSLPIFTAKFILS
ncbi:MAG: hypothetical protein EZS28_034667 [Streblomastix strix]|uniref:Uncharacterized protein n=1 Tax=Streblomastix strix TaxID=222440 RepID=A0A5J4UHB3_9EUKA|nr:MAG: hypothetical protein EZS28_034667 [Streblomastix strix]